MGEKLKAVRSGLAASRAELLLAVGRLDETDWDRPTSNPEWTARDILRHLASAEPGQIERIKRILQGTSALSPGFSLDVWNQRQVRKLQGSDVEDLLQSLGQSRQVLFDLIEGLDDAELDRRGWHARGHEVTLAEFFAIVTDHERSHAADILSAIPG